MIARNLEYVGRYVRISLLLTMIFVATEIPPTFAAETQAKAKIIVSNDSPYKMTLYVYGISWGSFEAGTSKTIFVPAGKPHIMAVFALGRFDEIGNEKFERLEHSRQLAPGGVYTLRYTYGE